MACNVFKSDDKGKQDLKLTARPSMDYDEDHEGEGVMRSKRQIQPNPAMMSVRHVRNS